jgi:hypothetical protein
MREVSVYEKMNYTAEEFQEVQRRRKQAVEEWDRKIAEMEGSKDPLISGAIRANEYIRHAYEAELPPTNFELRQIREAGGST